MKNFFISLRNSIQYRMMLIIGLSLLVLLSGLTIGVYKWQEGRITSSNTASVINLRTSILNLLQLQLKEKQATVSTSLKAARYVLKQYGELVEHEDTLNDFQCINQITKTAHTYKLPALFAGDVPIHNDFTIVDQIQGITNQTVTIFHKIDRGFLRVSTNVRKTDGSRAVGTFIPMDSPVIKTILRGETFRGRAFVVNDWYVTAYEPIYIEGEIKGILYVGVKEKDIDYLTESFQEITFSNSGYPYLINGKGELVIHPTHKGESIASMDFFTTMKQEKTGIITTLWGGKEDIEYIHFYDYHPDFDMYVGCAIPMNEFIKDQLYNLRNILVLGFVLSISILITIVFFSFKSIVTAPLQRLRDILEQISRGIIPDVREVHRKDELGVILESLNKVTSGQARATNFAKEVGQGKYTGEFNALSEEDVLGNALLNMRSNLKNFAKEEELRNWANVGYTKFGNILRNKNHDFKELSDELISELVNYMELNQGGIFVLGSENSTEYLELKACYAYDRKKFLEKKLLLGEGLVGQCWQERQTIYLAKVPKNYINISSGLGDAPPSAVLIVPLKVNEEICGVIELASFEKFEEYKIKFIETLAESIASSFSSIKTNEQTKKLLHQSQQQSEELRAQEEEMRQNVEELQSTQEEMGRISKESSGRINSIEQSFAAGELRLDGSFEKANEKLRHLFRLDTGNIQGKNFKQIISNFSDDDIQESWELAKSGYNTDFDISWVNESGQNSQIRIILSPLVDNVKSTSKIYLYAHNLVTVERHSNVL